MTQAPPDRIDRLEDWEFTITLFVFVGGLLSKVVFSPKA